MTFAMQALDQTIPLWTSSRQGTLLVGRLGCRQSGFGYKLEETSPLSQGEISAANLEVSI